MSLDHDLIDNLVDAFGDPWARGEPELGQLWQEYVALDLPGVGIAEDRGGSGGGFAEVVALAHATGRSALPLPMVEDHLARWLLTEAGRGVGTGPCTIALGDVTLQADSGWVSGTLRQVPWMEGDQLLVGHLPDPENGDELLVAELRLEDAEVQHRTGLAGQRVADVQVSSMDCEPARTGVSPAALRTRGRLLRAAQMAGAIQTVAALTLDYVRTRDQFGVPIGSFQSVQLHVVHLEQAATIALHAVEAATLTGSPGDVDAAWLVALDSAREAAAAAHQAHGAIGMTMEYPLQRYTRRLNAWRWDFGSQDQVARDLATPAFAPNIGVRKTLSDLPTH